MKVHMQVEIDVDDDLTKDDIEDIAQLEEFEDARINNVRIVSWYMEKQDANAE